MAAKNSNIKSEKELTAPVGHWVTVQYKEKVDQSKVI